MLAETVKRLRSLWPLRLLRRAIRLGFELYEAAVESPLAPAPTRAPSAAAPAAPTRAAAAREAAPVVLYVEWDSPGKDEMERILKTRGLKYKVLPIDHDEATRSFLENAVKREPPVLFIGGDPIGGLQELKALDASGDLVRRVSGELPPPAPTPPPPAAAGPLGNPERPAQVYGSRNDQWTGRCTILLEQRKVDFEFVDLDQAKPPGLRERLTAETSHNMMPYVFVRGKFVGGWNELDELDRLGQLDELLAGSDASAPSGRPRIRVVAAERPGEDVPPGSR